LGNINSAKDGTQIERIKRVFTDLLSGQFSYPFLSVASAKSQKMQPGISICAICGNSISDYLRETFREG